jgi:myo-inositol-1-phosphate synthase
MNKDINIAIVGVGNCAASLVMGLSYYHDIKDNNEHISGLMHPILGLYKISDIVPVAAFDIDRRKIGKDLSQAIFEQPNCTKKFCDVPFLNVEVMKTCVFDGIAKQMEEMFLIDNNQREMNFEEIVKLLKEKETDIIVSYLPVGTQIGTSYWTDIALSAGCAFVNCIPVFVASNKEWADKFKKARLPLIGDDIKSLVGATIVNRALVQMIEDRGCIIDNSWQLNVGGNTDFANMTDQSRLVSKKISKTESISSLVSNKDAYIYAGPNGMINCLNDNKISFMKIDFRIFGDIPCSLDIKLNVEDSPNSSGIVIDAIRIAKLSLDRNIGGSILSACAYFMKHPPIQIRDEDARKQLEDFIRG